MKMTMRATSAALLLAALADPATAQDQIYKLNLNLTVGGTTIPGSISGPIVYDATYNFLQSWNVTYTPNNGVQYPAFTWQGNQPSYFSPVTGNSTFQGNLMNGSFLLYSNASSGSTANISANANAGYTPGNYIFPAIVGNSFFYLPPGGNSANGVVSGTLAGPLGASIPEPSPLALAGLGSLALLALARLRRFLSH